jgi:hypothetical protein
MRRLFQLTVMVGVALAVPASPIVLAQIQKAAAPAQKEAPVGTTTVTVEVKKLVEPQAPVKAAKAKAQGLVEVTKTTAVVKAMGAGDPNLEPQVRQFIQQFRPAMRAEYYFLKSICAPTPEQRVALARDGEKAVRNAARAFAEAQRRPAQVRNGRAIYPDPRRLIEEEMGRAARDHLTPDQAARYVAESEKRAADRHRAAARNIVAKLDGDLVLNPEQRDKIAESILAQWDESWCQSLETLLYGDQYYPRLPDSIVVPHLDEAQARIWRGNAPNQNYFFGFVGNMMPQEDPREDKELIDARLATERDQPPLAPVVRRGMAVPAPAPPAAAVKMEVQVKAAPAAVKAGAAPK